MNFMNSLMETTLNGNINPQISFAMLLLQSGVEGDSL